jgi:pimeloyl-ACP methyl ester carboxylesterase
VVSDDGVTLHVEVDEPAEPTREATSLLTVVLVHGYALSLDCWHFQRLALRRTHRLVSYDQRSHGRSGRSSSEHCTIEQLGRDLAAVLDEVTGPGPVAVVGHSMGAMAIMALAEHRPEEFGTRVRAVAMISTTAGGLDAEALGLPGLPGRFLQRLPRRRGSWTPVDVPAPGSPSS